MKKNKLNELYWLRSIACLCVVTVHSITRVVEISGQHTHLMNIRLLLTFGTPIFIMLSEFLIAYKFPQGLPRGFYQKKAKHILIPYVCMAFVYAPIMCFEKGYSVFSMHYFLFVLRNLVFGFYRHGYFLLVIFQFYILHQVFSKWLFFHRPLKTIFLTFIFNALYLSFFNLVDPSAFEFGKGLWRGLTWGFFPAWVFYFVLGYYLAHHFEKWVDILKTKKIVLALGSFFSGLFVLFLYQRGTISVNDSKRVDMLLFSPLMMFLILSMPIKKSLLVEKFSSYTFDIYLYHMIFLFLFTRFFLKFPDLIPSPYFLLMMLVSATLLCSLGLSVFLKGIKKSIGGHHAECIQENLFSQNR